MPQLGQKPISADRNDVRLTPKVPTWVLREIFGRQIDPGSKAPISVVA